MGKLDFFFTQYCDSELQLEDGQYVNRHFDGEYNEYTEYCIREGDCLIYYYACHRDDTTTFFIYPGDDLSDMIKDIVRHIDIYNEPSVAKQWPYFYKCFTNYKSGAINKFRLLKVQDAYISRSQHMVFALTISKHIKLESISAYYDQLAALVDFASKAMEEIQKDNGCLNMEGFFRSFIRGTSLRYLMRKVFKL